MTKLMGVFRLLAESGGISDMLEEAFGKKLPPPLGGPPPPSWEFALLLAASVFWAISLILVYWAYGFGNRVTEEGRGKNACILSFLISATVMVVWIVYLINNFRLSEPTELISYVFYSPLSFVPAPLIATMCPGAIATMKFMTSFAYLGSKSPEVKASRSPMAAMIGGFVSVIQFLASIATLVMFLIYSFYKAH